MIALFSVLTVVMAYNAYSFVGQHRYGWAAFSFSLMIWDAFILSGLLNG